MARPSKYPRELRERAVRMVIESKGDYGSEYEAIRSICAKLGITSPDRLLLGTQLLTPRESRSAVCGTRRSA